MQRFSDQIENSPLWILKNTVCIGLDRDTIIPVVIDADPDTESGWLQSYIPLRSLKKKKFPYLLLRHHYFHLHFRYLCKYPPFWFLFLFYIISLLIQMA
jgi:hypothetical protein